MVVVNIPDRGRVITDRDEAAKYLAGIGIEYNHWESTYELEESSTQEEILGAYRRDIEELKKRGGYNTADVIDMKPNTPNLDGMLAKFSSEHWHDEDEVRFTLEGRGLFHVHPENGDVTVIEVSKGDLIRIPKNTLHWFNLCGEKRIRAISLFQNMSGWTPYYSGSRLDGRYQPVCMGPSYIPQK